MLKHAYYYARRYSLLIRKFLNGILAAWQCGDKSVPFGLGHEGF